MSSVPINQQAGYLVKQLQQQVRGALDARLAEHGVTMSTYAVLAVLQTNPGLSNADLARRSFVTAQTMNRLVHDLTAAGLVTRTPDAGHGRILRIDVTDAGRALLGQCQVAVDAVHEQMLSGLDPREQALLTDLLRRCSKALGGDY